MGSLRGHILPGVVFIVLAIWETVSHMKCYFECYFLHKPYKKALVMQRQRSSRLPSTKYLGRFIAILIGIAGEYFTALDSDWKFVRLHNLQHLTMYAGFLVPTIFEILYQYQVRSSVRNKTVDYLVSSHEHNLSYPRVKHFNDLLIVGLDGAKSYFTGDVIVLSDWLVARGLGLLWPGPCLRPRGSPLSLAPPWAILHGRSSPLAAALRCGTLYSGFSPVSCQER